MDAHHRRRGAGLLVLAFHNNWLATIFEDVSASHTELTDARWRHSFRPGCFLGANAAMASRTVELNAYVLPADHSVFKLFPGKSYRLSKEVESKEAAFLDIRGLDSLGNDPAAWTDDDILRVIAEDRVRRALSTQRAQKSPPSTTPIASDKRKLGFLKSLLFVAKRGDLVVIPLGEGVTAKVAIGEFSEEPGNVRMIAVRDGDDQFVVPGRLIAWHRRGKLQKRDLSVELIKALHSPSAFHPIANSLREEVYRAAYENFVFGGIFVSTFTTSKEHFTTADLAAVSIWFNALAATRDSLERGEALGKTGYLELGMSPTGDAHGDMAININSPGTVALRSLGAFALVMMSLFPLAKASVSVAEAKSANVTVKTVGSATSDCSLQIEQSIASYVGALGADRWKEACVLAKRASTDATLSTHARLSSPSRKRK